MPLALFLAAEGGGGGLTDIDRTLFFATLVLFALFAFVLAKFAWGPLLEAIEGREKSVRDEVEGALKANAEAAGPPRPAQGAGAPGGPRARGDDEARAKQDAEVFKNDLMAKARTEADQIVARAKEQIEREHGARPSRSCAPRWPTSRSRPRRKIVKSSLTPEAQKKLVTDFISSLPRVQ